MPARHARHATLQLWAGLRRADRAGSGRGRYHGQRRTRTPVRLRCDPMSSPCGMVHGMNAPAGWLPAFLFSAIDGFAAPERSNCPHDAGQPAYRCGQRRNPLRQVRVVRPSWRARSRPAPNLARQHEVARGAQATVHQLRQQQGRAIHPIHRAGG